MIPLTGNGGLFTRLGKLVALLNAVNTFRGRGYLNVSSISGSGTNVTVNVVQAIKVAVNDTVTITGSNISGYNGTFTVSSVTSGNQFAVTNSTTGTNTSTTVKAYIATGEAVLSSNSLVDNLWNTFTVAASGLPLDQFLVDSLYSNYGKFQTTGNTFAKYLQQTAQSIVQTMANDDTPLQSVTLANAMSLLITQMTTAAASVKTPTTTNLTSAVSLVAPVQSNVTQSSGGALTSGTTYYYTISAVSPSGESSWSNEKSGTPSGGNLTNNISWSAVNGAIGYRIYRGTSSTHENYLLNAVPVTGLTFADNALTYPDDPAALDDQGVGGGGGGNGGANASFTAFNFGSVNKGGEVLASTVVADSGSTSDYVVAEPVTCVCSADSQSSFVPARSESYLFTSPAKEADSLAPDWPLGSALSTTLKAVDPQQNQGTNLLNNSGFDTFTVANTPDNWTIVTGTVGGTIKSGSVTKANGSPNCLEFLGNGTELTAIKQQFGVSSGGTKAALAPLTTYALVVWVRLSATPTGGVLQLALVDGSGNVINDASSHANSMSLSLPAMQPCNYYPFVVHFRTPAVLPSSQYLQIKLTTALDNTVNVFVDDMAMAQPKRLYPGGPTAAVFASSLNKAIVGDSLTLTVTNKYDGQWQQAFQRLFNMTQLGLQIPSSGSPTISDSLLS